MMLESWLMVERVMLAGHVGVRIACGIRFYVGEDVAVKIGDGVVG